METGGGGWFGRGSPFGKPAHRGPRGAYAESDDQLALERVSKRHCEDDCGRQSGQKRRELARERERGSWRVGLGEDSTDRLHWSALGWRSPGEDQTRADKGR